MAVAFVYFQRRSLRREVSFLAANPMLSGVDSTHSLYLHRIAFKKVMITPLSIWRIGSCIYIKLMQKSGLSQNALNRRCAPAFLKASSAEPSSALHLDSSQLSITKDNEGGWKKDGSANVDISLWLLWFFELLHNLHLLWLF